MEEEGVTLVRRYSGGGAVYHDLGNGVFTFISPKKDHDIPRNLGIIVGALKKLKINAETSGRNDIAVDGKKISGSAFKNAKDKAIHHGTFLYDVNINALSKYLTPSKAKLLSKGVSSVAARVTNIRDLNPEAKFEQVNEAIISEFFDTYGGSAVVEEINPVKLQNNPSLSRYYSQLSDWHWRFGKTPEFEHHLETRFDWGQFDVYIQAKNGLIEDAKIYSDCLNPGIVEEFEKALFDIKYSTQGISEAAESAKKALSAEGTTASQVDELARWLAKSL
jgi:lipoate-protein ligase A